MIRRAMAAGLLALLCCAGAAPAQAQIRLDGKGPKQNTVSAADWLRHPHDDRYYQESWTGILSSADGWILYASFLYTNLGVLSGSSAVALSLTPPGGKAKAYRYDYATKDFSQDPATGTLRVGPNALSLKDGSAHLLVAEKGLRVDLRCKGWMPGAKLHGGRATFGKDRSQWVETYVHLPRCDASGSLDVGGRKVEFRGDGYVDHMVQNVLATDYSTRWWTLRFFGPDHSVAFLVYELPKSLGGGRSSLVMISDRERLLAFDDHLELKPSDLRRDPKGHSWAGRIDLSYSGAGGLRLEGSLQAERLHERDAVLERLSWMERKVAGLVAGNPVIYRYLAKPELRLSVPGQEPVQLQGRALVENLVLVED